MLDTKVREFFTQNPDIREKYDKFLSDKYELTEIKCKEIFDYVKENLEKVIEPYKDVFVIKDEDYMFGVCTKDGHKINRFLGDEYDDGYWFIYLDYDGGMGNLKFVFENDLEAHWGSEGLKFEGAKKPLYRFGGVGECSFTEYDANSLYINFTKEEVLDNIKSYLDVLYDNLNSAIVNGLIELNDRLEKEE